MECGITKYIHGGYQHTFEDENGNPYYPKYEQQNEKNNLIICRISTVTY